MQALAMITMLIDHIGLIWFPEHIVWRVIGRLAMPFYCFAIVLGYFRTSDVKRYMKRLTFIALLSQIPYQLAFDQYEVNTVGSLLLCLIMLVLLDKWKELKFIPYLIAGAFIVLMELLPFSYGAYAPLLVLIYRYSPLQGMTLFHFSLNVVSVVIKPGWILQLSSILATLLIAYMPNFLRSLDKVRIPRLLWRSFYPAHLLALALTRYMIIIP